MQLPIPKPTPNRYSCLSTIHKIGEVRNYIEIVYYLAVVIEPPARET